MKREPLSNQIYKKTPHRSTISEQPSYGVRPQNELKACSACGAVLADGKWQWMEVCGEIPLTRCPTCTRVYQKKPAGYVMLQGDFALDHRNEMLSLIHYVESREKMQDPLKRIMWIEYQEEGVTVTTTNTQLTHTIGEALLRAYQGELDYHFNELEELLLLRWKR